MVCPAQGLASGRVAEGCFVGEYPPKHALLPPAVPLLIYQLQS